MTDDATLGEGESVFGTPTPVPTAPETPLDLDELLSQARLVERTARICLRGDLYGDYTDAVEELSTLVDAQGVPLDDDAALGSQTRAQELTERIEQLRADMKSAMRTVRFRAMPDDEFRVFQKQHQDAAGAVKDSDAWNEQIVARCAIAPTMTVDQVRAIRGKLGPTQFIELANTAFYACTVGGVDVPKSPSFSRTPTRRESSRN